MVANKNPRFGGRSKFSAGGIQAAMEAALEAKKPVKNAVNEEIIFDAVKEVGEVIDGSLNQEQPAPTNNEETGQTLQATPELSTDVAVTFTPVTQIPNPVSTVTTASCVKALTQSLGFGRTALYLEVGVALAVFAGSSTGADLATKRRVMDLYSQAGFEIKNGGKDYKTVNRRVNTSAALFNVLGLATVNAAMHGLRDGEAIKALISHMSTTYKFDTINAILEFVGRPVLQTNTPAVREARAAALVQSLTQDAAADAALDERMAKQRTERQKKQEQESDGITIYAGNLNITIPRDTTAAEVMLMVARLTEYAEHLAEEAGTPEDQRNREMHS